MIIPTSGGVEPAGMLLQQALYAADHFSERLWGWRIFDELEVKTSLGATALRWSVGFWPLGKQPIDVDQKALKMDELAWINHFPMVILHI